MILLEIQGTSDKVQWIHNGDPGSLRAGADRSSLQYMKGIVSTACVIYCTSRVLEWGEGLTIRDGFYPEAYFPSQRYDRDFSIPLLLNGTPSAARRSSLRSHIYSDDSMAYGPLELFFAFTFSLSLPHSPRKPPINKLEAMTRWHGAAGAKGFLRRAAPTDLEMNPKNTGLANQKKAHRMRQECAALTCTR